MVSLVSVISSIIAHQMTADFEQAQYGLMGRAVEARLHSAENQAAAAAEALSVSPQVRAAFAARQRDELLALTKDAFEVRKAKYGFSQTQFHLPDHKSFLRVHNPSRFGDDQTSFRRLVVDANARKSLFKGVEITTSGIGIFGVAPIADPAGQHVGTVETAFEFGPMLDELKRDYGFELALFIDEKLLRSTATSLQGDVLNERNRVGKFVKFHATHGELMRALVNDGDIGAGEEAQYVRDTSGLGYGVVLKPVVNHAREQIGVIAVAQDFTAMRSASGRAILWQVLLGLLSVIVLSGLIVVTIRGGLLQPLAEVSERFSVLANTGGGEPMDPAEEPCDEIKQLARSYNALRDRVAGPPQARDGDGAEA